MRPMFDAHLDLAFNALYFNRDLRRTVAEVRAAEQGMTDELARERATVTLPELKRSRVGVCVATLLARSGPEQRRHTGFKRGDIDYMDKNIAHAHAKGQLAYYRQLEEQGHLRFILSREQLASHWQDWRAAPDDTPLGLILSMECADPIVAPEQVEELWQAGLRAVGPAHAGRGQYAYGTASHGPLGDAGRRLLQEFRRVGIILDVTHLSDESFFEALDVYDGPLLASHQNCRALVPGDRQFSDEQIERVIQRGGVLGTAFDAWMLYPGWKRGETSPSVVSMAASADHIDHVCQLAGNTRHSALGTDLDGRFGTEQTPHDLDTIHDVHQLEEILARRGYKAEEIDAIFWGNWLRFFGAALPSDTRSRA